MFENDTDLSMVPAALLELTAETATALGRGWTLRAILGSPLLVHRTGLHTMLNERGRHVLLTAAVAISANPDVPMKEVTALVPIADRSAAARSVAEAIRTRILPHFGRKDAIAGLRVLSLPLRDAGIPAVAHGNTERITIDYRTEAITRTTVTFEPGERHPLHVVIHSHEGHTRAEIRISHLTVEDAARIAASALPHVYTPVPVPSHLPAEAHELAAALPGMTATHIVSDVPRLTELTDPSGNLTVRHFLSVKDTGTHSWVAIQLRDAPISTAYALLAAYAAA